MPLERNAVRYLLNFSTGRRGAKSTEYFLQSGFPVIYLHSKGSCLPWTERNISSVKDVDCRSPEAGSASWTFFSFVRLIDWLIDCLIDWLIDWLTGLLNSGCTVVPSLGWRIAYSSLQISEPEMKRFTSMTCFVEYQDLDEYLFYLRRISEIITRHFQRNIIYLSAAVSDYYIPFDQMVWYGIFFLTESKFLINGVVNSQ